jgi:hypothetical protein
LRDDPDPPEFSVRTLWDREQVSRKERVCRCCLEPITVGTRYASAGILVDGRFELWVRHVGGELYPSGCPKWRERDLAELEARHRQDADLWNPPKETDDATA